MSVAASRPRRDVYPYLPPQVDEHRLADSYSGMRSASTALARRVDSLQ